MWRGVALLPTDRYLVIDGDGEHRSVRWWTPPAPVMPMAEGAAALRQALLAAVAARTRGRQLVGCDLGGVDSTAICSLAAHQDAKVVAYTGASPDPLADDVAWAGRTVPGSAMSSTTSSRQTRCRWSTTGCYAWTTSSSRAP